MYRRNLLGLVVAAAFTSRPLPALSGLLDDQSATTAVGSADVARLEQANRALHTADLLVGGAALSSAALLAQYRKATTLLHGTFAHAAQRSAMHSAVGHFGSTIRFMLFDVGEHLKARQVYLASLRVAGEATDRWALHAIICSELARQSCHLAAAAEADELIRIAHSAEAELTPTTKAMLHAVHATATAAAGDRNATGRYVGLAEDSFADSTPANDPEWITWFDAAELHGETGAALAVLATHHDDLRDDAVARLSTSAAPHGPGEQRSTALALTRLAAVHATRQDSSAAVKAARRALDIAERLRSPRIVDTLARLTNTLQPLAARPGVADVVRRTTALAAATA